MMKEGAGSRRIPKNDPKKVKMRERAGLVFNTNGGIWMGQKVVGECI
jgi:hypothetical protein